MIKSSQLLGMTAICDARCEFESSNLGYALLEFLFVLPKQTLIIQPSQSCEIRSLGYQLNVNQLIPFSVMFSSPSMLPYEKWVLPAARPSTDNINIFNDL